MSGRGGFTERSRSGISRRAQNIRYLASAEASSRRVVTHLWVANALSSSSTWVMQVGLFIYVLRGSPVSTLALVELAGTVPALVALPVAGTLADRIDPRRVAIASMIGQTVCVAAMAVLLDGELWLVAVMYAGQGVSNAAWPPARQQWLYLSVPPEDRARANAALGSIVGVTTVLGAGLGGALSAWSPLAALVMAGVLQALTLVPLLLLARVPLGEADAGEDIVGAGPERRGLWREVADGFVALRDFPLAKAVVWIGIAWGCIGGAYSVLLAGYVTDELGGRGAMLGGLLAVDGVAVVVGSLLAARTSPRRHLRLYSWSYIVQGAAWAGLFVSGTVYLAVVVLAIMRLASGVIIALDPTILLATVPAGLRGRVASLHMTTYLAMARVSLAVFGVLLTVTDTVTLGVAAGLSSVALGVVWWWRRDPDASVRYLAATVHRPGHDSVGEDVA